MAFTMTDTVKTIIVDLSAPEEEIFSNIHKNARWGVKRAKKEGLKVIEGLFFKDFYRIYLGSMKLKNITPFSPKEMFDELETFFVCKHEEKVIGGLVITINSKGLPEVEYNASLSEYQKFQPNDLLYWEAILWAKRKGFEKIDLGGYSVKPHGELIGINKFKEKWSKNIVSEEVSFSFSHLIKRKILRNSGFFRKIRDNIRKVRNDRANVYLKMEKELEALNSDSQSL